MANDLKVLADALSDLKTQLANMSTEFKNFTNNANKSLKDIKFDEALKELKDANKEIKDILSAQFEPSVDKIEGLEVSGGGKLVNLRKAADKYFSKLKIVPDEDDLIDFIASALQDQDNIPYNDAVRRATEFIKPNDELQDEGRKFGIDQNDEWRKVDTHWEKEGKYYTGKKPDQIGRAHV